MGQVQKIRERIVTLLGGRCNSSECRWVGIDGIQGCDDLRCLQIDHIFGNGREEALLKGNSYQQYKQILDDPDKRSKYQLLCANCNWIKRRVNNEYGGGRKGRNIDRLSVTTRASYISDMRRLTNLLPSLLKNDEIKKATEKLSWLTTRLASDGVDVTLLMGGRPRNCRECDAPISKGHQYCSDCIAAKKQERGRIYRLKDRLKAKS
jgi:hypothetical protein